MNNKENNIQDIEIDKSTKLNSYQSLLEIPLPILIVRRDKFSRYVLHSFNKSAQEIFAVPLERLINKEVRIFWPKEYWDDFRKAMIASIRKGFISDVSSVSIEKEGKVRSFNLRLWRIDNSLACCVFLDTIDKKLFTQSVLDEKLKYEELFKNTPVMMLNIDIDGKILDANFYWQDKTGFERSELIGKNIQDFFVDNSETISNQKTFSELLISNELKNFPIQLKTKNGDNLLTVITARPLFDINGKFIRCYLVAQDISELHSIQKEFENVEKILKALFENSATAILLYSDKYGVVECNIKAEDLFETKRENLIGKKLNELSILNENQISEKLRESIKSEQQALTKFEISQNQNGHKRFLEISFTKILLKDEPYYLIFFYDKSIEKIKDEKILETEKRFQTLFEESINALKLMDISGKILKVNKKGREIFEEFIDKENRLKIKTKDFDYQKWLKDFIKSEKTQEKIEYKFKSNSGLKIIEEKLLKITFDSGEKIIFSIAREITNEKLVEEELRKREQNLRYLNETKNRLINILSHDLRAPTSSIIGLVNAILGEPNLERTDIVNYLNLVKSAASFQLDLINNLLDWSLLETGNFNYSLEPKNLEYAVYNSLNSIRGLAEQKKIKLDVKVHSCLVLIDLNLFSRIMINLVSNAIKFSYPESKIYIQSKELKNNRIEIMVKDNGVGFDKEVLDKLFTFKEKVSRHGTSGEKGTGFGLSLCKDMVKILGGKLKIESPLKSTGKKSYGSLVSFDVKIVEPKILVSYKLDKTSIRNALKKSIKDYNFVFKDISNYFKQDNEEYFVFIVIEENDLNNQLIEKIYNKYRSKRNIIVVTKTQSDKINELKSTTESQLTTFLKNEIERIEFEWKQQANLAKQMRKFWD